MGKEIERKFWVKKINMTYLFEKEHTVAYIDQGYLINEHGELRIRRKNKSYFMTVKSDGGQVRDEWEVEIPAWVFETLWPATVGKRINKQRFTIKYGVNNIEIDAFRFNGNVNTISELCLMEVEFASQEEASAFVLPEFILDAVEVTEDPNFKNKKLAIQGLPSVVREWNNTLKKK